MFEVKLYELGYCKESEYTRVIMVSNYKGKWIYCKHKQRDTWEIPGGHIEEGEDWLTAAKRELFEETGATKAEITPVCVYSISTFALLCYADIKELQPLPQSEMEKIELFDDEPKNLTYEEAHKKFFKRVKEFLKTK